MGRNETKKPVTRGVAKVPVVMQLEALECGAACLAMTLAYYNKWIPLEQVRIDCGVSRDGSNAGNIIKAARSYGMETEGFRLEPEQLRAVGTFPCIIHWNFNHFVVLNGFHGNKAYLNDPAKGTYAVSMDIFDKAFTGVCIFIEPGDSFAPSGKQKSVIEFARRRLSNLRAPVIFAVLTTVTASLLGVINPVFNRIFYDRLLSGQNPEWVTPFIIAVSAIAVIQIINAAVKASVDLRLNGKINIVGNLSYMWKLLHLPIGFFSQRLTGDIASRQASNASVANTLVNVVAPLFLNTIMMVFYLAVMIRYSRILTVVGIVTAVINMAISGVVAKKRVNLTRVATRDGGKLSAATVSGIRMIETIKSSGAEEGFFEKWSGHFAAVNASEQKFAKQNYMLSLIPGVLSTLAGGIIMGIGVYLTINGQFTVGSITAFQGFFSSFMSPVSKMIGAGQTIQEMRTNMERIDDVLEYPEDENVRDIEPEKDETVTKLSGNIEINNITFGYSPLAAPLIENFSMSIKRGSRVAFVGASGCGKSTLAKLISGLYSPWSGEITFDGKRVDRIDHSVFTGSLAVVDQDITLFEDTIANNIKMWDNSIEDFEMILAAKDAQMHYDIMERADGYQYRLTENGKDFSGGQRQRLEIARVLAQEPNIIILDEATSALDAKTEYDVVKAIEDRGITCIVIAHRLSTIRDCDEIVVLERGRVVERGTHDELMTKNGVYTGLVTNE